MNAISGFYNRRIRGFRVVNFFAVLLLAALLVVLYWSKTRASGDSVAIASLDRKIAAERSHIRLMKAKVANLEQPERIGPLSQTWLKMGPAKAAHEAAPEKLPLIAGGTHRPAPAPAPAVAPAPEAPR